jgi:hypothetical protein
MYHATWGHLNDVLHVSPNQKYQQYSLSNFWSNNLNTIFMPEPIFMKFRMYIMRAEVTATVYCINLSHQKYQYCSLSNFFVLLTSLHVHTEDFSAAVWNTQTVVKGK